MIGARPRSGGLGERVQVAEPPAKGVFDGGRRLVPEPAKVQIDPGRQKRVVEAVGGAGGPTGVGVFALAASGDLRRPALG
jgi:hypothetical protein